MIDYKIFKLSNGMRCIHTRTDSHVAYIGVAVNIGSRDEDAVHHGLAHFVEHTIFKGTCNRSSWHISNRMESIGGELNAYTSKEETVVYTSAPSGDPARSLELLADLVANSTFPAHEIDKEREVVVEEINSYLDSPAETVFDNFEDKIYAGNGLGHNILGTPGSVRRLTGRDARTFVEDYYTPTEMVVYVSDPSTHDKIERLAEKYFGRFDHTDKDRNRVVPATAPRFEEMVSRDGHQAHTIIGARVCSRYDEMRFPLFLLNNYLGGPCMNSLLNQQLREKRGYVYTVDSFLSLLSDCGLMTIYFGSDIKHVDKCKNLIRKQLDSLCNDRLSESALDRIKRQYIGQLRLSTDHRESYAMSFGKSILYYNEVHDSDWTVERLRAVTPEQVRTAAQMLAPENCSMLTLY